MTPTQVPVDALPAAIPALVTIGHREGRQLMIDLEAYGAITVSGTDASVDAFQRSVALELAADQDLADAYVYAVGFDPGVGHLDRASQRGGVDKLGGAEWAGSSTATKASASDDPPSMGY